MEGFGSNFDVSREKMNGAMKSLGTLRNYDGYFTEDVAKQKIQRAEQSGPVPDVAFKPRFHVRRKKKKSKYNESKSAIPCFRAFACHRVGNVNRDNASTSSP